jgi:hypothetical protein
VRVPQKRGINFFLWREIKREIKFDYRKSRRSFNIFSVNTLVWCVSPAGGGRGRKNKLLPLNKWKNLTVTIKPSNP